VASCQQAADQSLPHGPGKTVPFAMRHVRHIFYHDLTLVDLLSGSPRLEEMGIGWICPVWSISLDGR
jgi:hypothetical protein